MTVAQSIKAVRLELGLTQEQLAAMTGIPQDQISKWENGHRKPSAGSLAKLARAGVASSRWLGEDVTRPGRAARASVDTVVRGLDDADYHLVLAYARRLVERARTTKTRVDTPVPDRGVATSRPRGRSRRSAPAA